MPARGVPVPEVFDVSGADIVMALAAGPTMVDVLIDDPHLLPAERARLERMLS